VSLWHPQLTELEQCAIGSEQHNKLYRRHAMMASQAKEERGDRVRGDMFEGGRSGNSFRGAERRTWRNSCT
jgi:hypothetical protein